MAVVLTGTGGLMVRVGLLAGGLNQLNSQRGATLDTRIGDIADEYLTNQRTVIDGIWATRDAARSAGNTLYSSYVTLSQNTLIRQVNDDTPLSSQTVLAALTVLVDQMTGANYIRQPTTSATVTAGSGNVGNAQVVVSLLDGSGLSRDYVYAESLLVTATNDASRGATAFREAFTCAGEPAVAVTAYDWPQGSGGSLSITATDAAQDGVVTEGDFETGWTSTNTPPSPWVIQTGTAGTTVFRGTNPARSTETYCLRLTGTGAAENTTIEQDLTSSLGTRPLTAVSFNLWVRVDSTPAAGVLQMRLVDGSNAVIADEAGTSNSTTKALTGVSTTYVPFNVTFRLPNDVPDTVKLQLRLSTAITSGRSVDIDLVQGVLPSAAYNGGPFVSVFSGTTASVKDDYYTLAVATDGDTGDFCRSFDRIYGLRDLNVRIPSSGTPTINDNLII